MKTAPVNKIIPFSSVDGPGNRTAIFLQGCNFDCKYCHNPETRALCVNCGLCVEKCPAGALTLENRSHSSLLEVETDGGQLPIAENGDSQNNDVYVIFDPIKCVQCDTCIHLCPHDASPRIQNLTASEVFEKVAEQMPYIRGITVSGGECTLYPEFLTELFTICQEHGLTTFIDSNGTYDFSKDPALMAVTDAVMLDVKAFGLKDHMTVTSCGNAMVLQNATYLAEIGKLFEVRTVVVPDLYDTEDTIRKTGALLKPFLSKASIRYKIIAYRPMGVREEYSHYVIPSEDYLEALRDILMGMGWRDIVVI